MGSIEKSTKDREEQRVHGNPPILSTPTYPETNHHPMLPTFHTPPPPPKQEKACAHFRVPPHVQLTTQPFISKLEVLNTPTN